MSAPNLRTKQTPDAIWEELVFSEARLEAHDATRPLALPFEALRQRVEAEMAQRRVRRAALVKARAVVTEIDVDLDDGVIAFDRDLLVEVGHDHDDPRYRLYFPERRSNLTRLGLESQIKAMRPWLQHLSDEESEALAAYRGRFEALMERGAAALAAREQVMTERSAARARGWTSLIDEVNATREVTYAELLKMRKALGRSRRWARTFFA